MLVSHLRSIIAAEELNFCVRNENRCFLLAMGTEVRLRAYVFLAPITSGVGSLKPHFDVDDSSVLNEFLN